VGVAVKRGRERERERERRVVGAKARVYEAS